MARQKSNPTLRSLLQRSRRDPDFSPAEKREIWEDFNNRQQFEHDLINRKTTWGLTTQAILLAGYGVTFRTGNVDPPNAFRDVLAFAGMAVGFVTLVGVCLVTRSKYLSWRQYRAFYDDHSWALPKPMDIPPPTLRDDIKDLLWRLRRRVRASSDDPSDAHNSSPIHAASGARLEWGVRTANTVGTLLPDVAMPIIFILAWSFLRFS